MRSTFTSMAARRASVSRLPRPQSTRSRVRSVSSSVMLPELPDARMETRKPIALPSNAVKISYKRIFRMMALRFRRVNSKRELRIRMHDDLR
jgi:hypothetical protein